jgi:hypothetical protein
MAFLHLLNQFLLPSTFGKTLLGPVITTGAAMLLGLPADPQGSPLLVGRITLVLLVVCGTWYEVKRSELERAASEARSADFEDRLRYLILWSRNESVAAAECSEEPAIGALRSSLCGLEAQAAGADVSAAAAARAYLALLEREGLIGDLDQTSESPGDEGSPR